jgi:hypothetical protein
MHGAARLGELGIDRVELAALGAGVRCRVGGAALCRSAAASRRSRRSDRVRHAGQPEPQEPEEQDPEEQEPEQQGPEEQEPEEREPEEREPEEPEPEPQDRGHRGAHHRLHVATSQISSWV